MLLLQETKWLWLRKYALGKNWSGRAVMDDTRGEGRGKSLSRAAPLHARASPHDSSLAEGWLRSDRGSRSPLNANRLSLCKER